MNKDKNSNSDQFFLFIISIILAIFVVNRYGPPFLLFLVRHRYWVATLISSTTMAVWIAIRQKLVAAWETQEAKTVLFKRQGPDSICVGRSKSGQPVYIPLAARRMHVQVVGTTNAGKTESVIIPWAISDIREGRGLILIDGKSDRALLDKLYAYCVKHRRAKDFRLLSLVNVGASSTINPLVGGTPEEITERVFSSFTFEDEYYRNQQYEVLKHVLIIFNLTKTTPTFQRLIQVITDPDQLMSLAKKVDDDFIKLWVSRYVALAKDERERRSSGLITQMGHFTTGETAALFNDEFPLIDIEQAMREGLIVYCQLPVMKTPVLGKATGKMILQAIQSAVSTRHLDQGKDFKFYSVYLDDFTEYLTLGFVSLLNKSRSGNIGVTFAHQAQGDLAGLGDDVRNTIMTNSNLKVFMRTNEPETAEYFSRTIGTRQNVKLTERQRTGTLGKEKTGDSSLREVEEFVHHPNLFKRELGTGDAVMIVPLAKRNHAVQLKFSMMPDLPAVQLPTIAKTTGKLLDPPPKPQSKQQADQGKFVESQPVNEAAPADTINQALEGAA